MFQTLKRILGRKPTFEAFRGPSGFWFCRERAANGEILNVSEEYASKSNAVRAAKRQAEQVGGKWKVIE